MHSFLVQHFDHLPIPVPAFGAWVLHRRQELGLSTKRAAALTGIETSDWLKLETGWVPTKNERLLRSLAGTLEVRYAELDSAISPLEAHFADTLA
jgi:hypothetical protein